MAGNLRENLTFNSAESQLNYSNIRFEPGLHGPPRSYDEIFERVYDGKHTWNIEVAQRISSYDPEVVALDGQDPLYHDSLNVNQGLDLTEKLRIWHSLPADPNLIHPSGAFYLVRGDLEFFRLIDLPLDRQDPDYGFQQRQLNRVAEEMLFLKEDLDTSGAVVFEMSARASLGVGGYAGVHYATREKSAEKEQGEKRKISRRDFIRLLAGLGFLSPTVAPTLGGLGASYAEEEWLADMSQEVLTFFRPRVAHNNWVDARTALVIAKTQDSFAVLNKPSDTPAAVVMGAAHAFEGEILLKSAAARTKVIKNFVGELVDRVDGVVAKYPLIPKDESRQRVLDNIAKADIVSITDPGIRPGEPDFLGYLDNSMQLTHSLQSPQVEEAIAQFR